MQENSTDEKSKLTLKKRLRDCRIVFFTNLIVCSFMLGRYAYRRYNHLPTDATDWVPIPIFITIAFVFKIEMKKNQRAIHSN